MRNHSMHTQSFFIPATKKYNNNSADDNLSDSELHRHITNKKNLLNKNHRGTENYDNNI